MAPRASRQPSAPEERLPSWVHPLEWDDRRTQAFWEFAGSSAAFRSRFFAELAAPYLVRKALRMTKKPRRALDVGTGTGAILRGLVSRRVPCVGLDASLPLLQGTRATGLGPAADLLRGDARRLPFRDKAFSLTFLLELLEHLPAVGGERLLGEIARVAEPGGTLVVTTPANEDLSAEATVCPECGAVFHRTQHVRSFRPSDVERLVSRYGFSIQASRLVDFHYVNSPFPARVIKRLAGLIAPSSIVIFASRS